MMPRKSRFCLVVLSVLYLIVNVATLQDGHTWCADFGQYLGHARNIIEHKDYAHTYYIGRSVVTPPGFPLILTPLLKYGGLNFRILKLPNIIFFLGFIWVLYAIMRKRLGEDDAFWPAVLFLTSPDFFIFKQDIMSDPAFLFFITASIFLWLRYEDARQHNRAHAAFLCLTGGTLLMCVAFFVRWAGLALFIALLIYFSQRKPERRAVIFILAGLSLSWVIQQGFGTDGLNYYHEVARPVPQWLLMSGQAMPQVIKTLAIFFFPCKTAFALWFFRLLNVTINIVTPVFFGGLVLGFLYKLRKRTLTLIETFIAVYLLGNLVWYFSGGTRYFYPVIGFLILSALEGVRTVSRSAILKAWHLPRIARWIIVFLVFHNIISVLTVFDYDHDQIYKKDARSMVSWIQNNTHPEDRFVFGKPRELGFLTRRYMTSYLYLREKNDACGRIRNLNVRYFIFEDYKEKYILPELNLPDVPLSTLGRNDVLIPFNIDTQEMTLEDIRQCQVSVALVWGQGKEYKIYEVLEN
ncbi:MAG TPA: glycosyltransferase family 39 protein [Candidatus Omnitrophota bacterium]|nr:glycosyltransferase family 39 protein [Candidatus Omnitrophota bacterium]HQP12673.1 glycosyltransferase family 39 protein [Candidatus Omnitrophota bacterium]